ncbi:hypothetical protein MKW98_026639 [Papaver atlanticum]|uniref:Aluminum-activated malate transporter n=1 Tax=Papaver atlanticum TaxID=357466 RepID=A0AAD4X6K3_9MAGN|nr:hypothetical protein MKW98_026639 [Papaver atlanticum]
MGSVKINIPCLDDQKPADSSTKTSKETKKIIEKKSTATAKGGGVFVVAFKRWIHGVKKFAKEDKNRVIIFSLKVGFAILIVSLLVLFQSPYKLFGNDVVWCILTVASMFEYTVRDTFNKGVSRVIGCLLAGILAVAIDLAAIHSGPVAEPYIIGIGIFFFGCLFTSILKLKPSMEPYGDGFRTILLTFCTLVVSGYRVRHPLKTAVTRLYLIAIGGFVAALVNVLIFPILAGEELHKELVVDFDSVADSLEECVKKYLEDDASDQPEFSKTVLDEFPDEPAYQKCRSALDSSKKLETLANSAKWEPPHGRFCHFLYPWSEYVKVGTVLRYCAYEVKALHGVLHSEIQKSKPSSSRTHIRCLGKDIKDLKHTPHTALQEKLHSTEHLRHTTFSCSDSSTALSLAAFTSSESTAALSLATFTSLLIEFFSRLDHLAEAVDELAKTAKFKPY